MNEDLLAKVYEKVGEMHAQLGVVLSDHKDLKARVGKLETQWARFTGMLAVIGLPVTIAITYIKRKIS